MLRRIMNSGGLEPEVPIARIEEVPCTTRAGKASVTLQMGYVVWLTVGKIKPLDVISYNYRNIVL